MKAVKSAGHRGFTKATTSLHNKINSIPELGMINPTMGQKNKKTKKKKRKRCYI